VYVYAAGRSRVLEAAMRTNQHHASTESVLAEKIFACTPKSVADARGWAKQVYVLADGPDPDACELLVSEVVTNAVVHTSGDEFLVRILSTLYIEVWDMSHKVPQRRQATEDSTDGRGLEILELLAGGYEVVLGDSGKAIRFHLKGV
jgi:hypothetical protein